MQLILGLAVAVSLVWLGRRPFLIGAASVLVEEDPLAPVEMLVASNSMVRATALEAALLYKQQTSARIVIANWGSDPLLERIRELGVPLLGPTELSKAILEHSGVPSSAITVLPGQVDGTGSEVAAIAAFVERFHPASLMVLTARSHTARTKWLLEREIDGRTRVSVRASRFDSFSAGAWWSQREQGREVVSEYLRWVNTALLRDFWSRPPSGQQIRSEAANVKVAELAR